VTVVTQNIVGIPRVIAMVMSENYASHLIHGNTLTAQLAHNMGIVDTCINQNSKAIVANVRTIATAPATKGNKLKPAH
jgi:hypothetical protein